MKYRISDDLKTIREILKMSQGDLAKEIGMTQVTIARLENNANNPSLDTLDKIYNFADLIFSATLSILPGRNTLFSNPKSRISLSSSERKFPSPYIIKLSLILSAIETKALISIA